MYVEKTPMDEAIAMAEVWKMNDARNRAFRYRDEILNIRLENSKADYTPELSNVPECK